jgi:hypothetical protein
VLTLSHDEVDPAERGSTLILMPVAALIFVVLGSLAVDATVLFLAERELAGTAAGAANDAATQAIDIELFYDAGCLRLDEARAGQVVAGSVAAKRLGDAGIRLDPPDVVARGRRVTVTVDGPSAARLLEGPSRRRPTARLSAPQRPRPPRVRPLGLVTLHAPGEPPRATGPSRCQAARAGGHEITWLAVSTREGQDEVVRGRWRRPGRGR